VAANTVDDYTPVPIASLEAGIVASGTQVVLSAPAGYQIRYTLDGNEPTAVSTLYSTPITITQTTVVRARSYAPAGVNEATGHTLTNTYLVDANHPGMYIVSLSGGTQVDNLLDGQQSEPLAAIEIFDENGQFLTETEGDINKHGNDSWAYDQRGFDWISRDEMGIDNELDHQFFSHRDRDEFQRLIFKAAANDNYPFSNGGAHIRDSYVQTLAQRAGMEVDCRSHAQCVLYKNGLYWGIYDIREKVDDHDYTSHYYNQGEKWIDFIKTWGATWAEYGSITEWDALKGFISNNDMTVAANYDYVEERLDVLSLIDYFIINNHTVCQDWLNWNTGWWRGRKPDGQAKKWRYILWDMDATFGHYINYTGVPNTGPDADPCQANDLPSDNQGHGNIVSKLLTNPNFHSLYVNRLADMNNTYLSCDYMIPLLDSMIAVIEPEMPAQIAKWGGNMNTWNANVQALRDFILARCQQIDGGIVGCYEVEGPYPLTVQISPNPGAGKVKVNTIEPTSFPWSGDYFSPVTMSFVATPTPGWVFSHWQSDSGSFTSPTNLALANFQFPTGATVTAVFIPELPCGDITNLSADSTNNAISLSWSPQQAAWSYELQYREYNVGADWNTIMLPTNNVTIGNLKKCTLYEVRVRSVCNDPNFNNYTQMLLFTKCPPVVPVSTDESAPWALSVWPNPTTGSCQVLCQSVSTHQPLRGVVVSGSGQVVLETTIQVGLPQTLSLDGLPEGLYFLRLMNSDGQSSSHPVMVRY
jgi:hypothetical protein